MINISAIISKCIAILLFAISFITPGYPDNADISVTVSEQESPVIYVEWINNTGKAITGPTYYIEKLENEQWKTVEFAEGFGFPEIYTQYYPTEGGRITIDTNRDLKEPPAKGTYRITLCYELLYSSTKNGTSAAEFTIG